MEWLKASGFVCLHRVSKLLLSLIHSEIDYKKENGYLVADPESKDRNRAVIYRRGMLKKYAESDLFLKASKKKDGVLVDKSIIVLQQGFP